MYKTFASIIFFIISLSGFSQDSYIISGTITEHGTHKPVQSATVHIKGSNYSSLSKADGSFRLHINNWYDSLEVSSVGFDHFTIALQKEKMSDININLTKKMEALKEVVVELSRKKDKSFIEKVIEHKKYNDPQQFGGYKYQRYMRSELGIDNLDFEKAKGRGLKSLMAQTYTSFDSNAKTDKELPIYFTERLGNNYHSSTQYADQETIIAQKTLGLATDKLLYRFDKFYLQFNVYDDWVHVFDQMYVSPLNTNAFNYYNFYKGDSLVADGDTLVQVRFIPKRSYERAFTGAMWINTSMLAVETIDMHLPKTLDLNFVNDITYSEEYKQLVDSTTGGWRYMPYKYSAEIRFQSGLALLGLPVPEDKSTLKFIIRNTTITNNIQFSNDSMSHANTIAMKKEQTTEWSKPDSFWLQHRPEPLTLHEQNIYKMVDSLQQNNRFRRNVKLIAFAGSGYWDFGNNLRIGPYSSFISRNPIEGWRVRLGFWTMPGISKKINFFGYGAYSTKDMKLKGMLGLKYVWNDARWTKTTIGYSSDYDLLIDQDDELDNDNIISSVLRKNVPYTRTFVKQAIIKHEQYLSLDFTAKGNLTYKELSPVFDFSYRPINPEFDKPYDSIYAKRLPVAEGTIGIRYAHKECTTILNYDNIKLGSFYPVVAVNYSYGIEIGKSQFDFQKINISVEQMLQLPPKTKLYYKLDAGKIFGTVPYLLLNIPAGNEYYVASRYLYNTMTPYEFASDRYINLHTRFYLGGAILDKIPFLQKLGWRERFSFNAYWGDMNKANIDYNKKPAMVMTGKPFMEAGVGIENIFHVFSIEYFRRLSYLNNPYARRDGIYIGLNLLF